MLHTSNEPSGAVIAQTALRRQGRLVLRVVTNCVDTQANCLGARAL